MLLSVRPIPAQQTHALRQCILRPHQSLGEMRYPGDDAGETVHFGAFDDGRLVGIASMYIEPFADDPWPGDWRLRGMAVADTHRGGGVGRRLLDACRTHALAHDGRRIWCNARLPACAFYERYGFTAFGEVFDLPGIGPHLVMVLSLGSIS